MKLSEVKGERVLDVIADIVEPVVSIATSEEFKALFKKADNEADARANIVRAVPSLIKSHKDEAIAILAAIGGVTKEQYVSEMTFPTLIRDVNELLTDDVFTDFLASASPTEDQAQSTSD